MKLIQGLLLLWCSVFVNGQVRGGSNAAKRHRLKESDGRSVIDLTSDIGEAEMRKIRQRYLYASGIRVSSPLNIYDDYGEPVAGRRDKSDKSEDKLVYLPVEEVEEVEVESMSYSMSFSMSMSMMGRIDKAPKAAHKEAKAAHKEAKDDVVEEPVVEEAAVDEYMFEEDVSMSLSMSMSMSM